MNLLELNLSRIDAIFQLETGELRKTVGDHFTTQEKLRIIVIVVYNDLDSFFLFQIIPSVSTAFTGQPLQIPCSSFKVNPLYKKTDPRENPERNSGYAVNISTQESMPINLCPQYYTMLPCFLQVYEARQTGLVTSNTSANNESNFTYVPKPVRHL